MNILILGASGFIGHACYDFFSEKNEVTGVDIKDRYQKGVVIDPDFNVTKKLILDKQFDVILNCAGTANIRESFRSPQNDFLSNTAYVEKVLLLIKEFSQKTKFIQISSAAVYGNPEKLPVTEDTPVNPLSPYGVNKLKSEAIVKEYSRLFALSALSVRIFSAYGVGLRQQFFYDLYSKLNADPRQVILFGTGNESRDFIFISDIIAALDILIKEGEFKGEVYNLASGEESFIKDAAFMFAGILNYKGKIIFSNEQLEGYPLNWRADISKLKVLGFSPKIKMEQGQKLYVSWLKNNFK